MTDRAQSQVIHNIVSQTRLQLTYSKIQYEHNHCRLNARTSFAQYITSWRQSWFGHFGTIKSRQNHSISRINDKLDKKVKRSLVLSKVDTMMSDGMTS